MYDFDYDKKDVEKIAKTAKMFKVYNQDTNKKEPVKLTWHQKLLYYTIVKRIPDRNHIITYTRFGKSWAISLGLLIRAVTHQEKWAIVAPSTSKAMIIMRYVIEHCYDNPDIRDQLDMKKGAKDRLRREVSKKRITFKNGGEIYVLSADARNKDAAGEALMGFGSPNLILDESSLIDDDIYAKAKRMLGDQKNNFLLEIGNPFRRNHFYKASKDPRYNHIKVDWKIGVKEGRTSKEHINEMRDEADFDILYNCNFPDEEEVRDGWSLLYPEKTLDDAQIKENPNSFGERRLGVDLGAGGDYSVWVLRTNDYARVLAKTQTKDTMAAIGITRKLMDKHGVEEQNCFIDATGLGKGILDRFHEQGINIEGINFASKALDQERFINIRAEAYNRGAKWLKQGGKLEEHPDWSELVHMRYKTRSNGKIQIVSKQQLRKWNIHSPDVADAYILTHARPDVMSKFKKTNKIRLTRSKQPKYN